ncbi:hypothetical protein [Corynebacterium pelargi]|uniref:Galactokinase n=1 Tax=Corynebacterium pelargi TaxID=1471400 RepID=A0A410W7L1_9CORY|nr:hypothetical protein [Corynebacterium pelargi]QAU51945.1 galactokinase [Corynebacterium pelargi]GGG71271.1 galactokinase [Corynebacterium pelargi]
MPLWSTKPIDVEALAFSTHREWTDGPAIVASAPATCPLLGELSDHAGGMVLVGLGHQRLAVARTARKDSKIQVRHIQLGLDGETASDDYIRADLQQLRSQQPSPNPDLAQRVGTVVLTMMHRQLISRETPGMDVTVLSSIPRDAGLGESEALDIAIALTLVQEPEEHQLGPARTKLANVCAQAAATISNQAPSRARYTAALRGQAQALNVMDYADGSITQVTHPQDFGYQLLAVCPPQAFPEADQAAMQRFIDDVTTAFAAPSLRLLPNARERVLAWLRAVHQVHPKSQAPSVDQAQRWLHYLEHEIDRTVATTSAIRSRRTADIVPAMNASNQEYVRLLDAPTALEATAQLCLQRGAAAARCSGASVLCLVPDYKAESVAEALSEDGLEVMLIQRGEQATTKH